MWADLADSESDSAGPHSSNDEVAVEAAPREPAGRAHAPATPAAGEAASAAEPLSEAAALVVVLNSLDKFLVQQDLRLPTLPVCGFPSFPC